MQKPIKAGTTGTIFTYIHKMPEPAKYHKSEVIVKQRHLASRGVSATFGWDGVWGKHSPRKSSLRTHSPSSIGLESQNATKHCQCRKPKEYNNIFAGPGNARYVTR